MDALHDIDVEIHTSESNEMSKLDLVKIDVFEILLFPRNLKFLFSFWIESSSSSFNLNHNVEFIY